jgi:hypothetical protein
MSKQKLFVPIVFNLILSISVISALMLFDDRYFEILMPFIFFVIPNILLSGIAYFVVGRRMVNLQPLYFASTLKFLVLYVIMNISVFILDNQTFLFKDFVNLCMNDVQGIFTHNTFLLHIFAVFSFVLTEVLYNIIFHSRNIQLTK